MKDTKFSIAIHILSMIALSPHPINSVDIAKSVGTNPSYIRKIMSLLKDHKIIESHRGKTGIQLLVDPGDLDLLTIYKIVEEENPHIFQVHQNANAECPVGRNIVNAVFPFLDDAEKRLQHSLQHDTLADVIDRLKQLERSRNHEGSTTN
ncbi:Rrf2 family transcriptional regulator [Lactobacillus johnsonii]|uniref:Rrf2 family transcriptional regulator n=1 Tax=Lactobacillus johnsonii TaxID=33959 RepID=UPI000B98035D|nr:Rrf2 family transcriptional regulator [Lactobacillus johnsonii]OYS06847.1 transcriptional regulator [Lactobacillus johnsonii]OYS12607.1 transcriptional regulator [Lactobacillus johnsonii]